MKALLVFGPHHGGKWDVLDQTPPELYVPHKYEPKFVDNDATAMLAKRVCRYTLLDVLSDDRTGEDCALYSHHPGCSCHEQVPPERKEPEQSLYDRYRAAQAAKMCDQRLPEWMQNFEVTGTKANPHYSAPAYSSADLMRDLGFQVVADPNMPIGLRVIQNG